MKKEGFIGCAIFGALCAVSLQAATIVYDDCAFCGGGVAVIDDDPIVIDNPTPSSGCAFCGGYGYSYTSSSSSYSGSSSSSSWNSGTDWSRATSKKAYIVDGNGGYAGVATITTSKKSSKGKVSVKIVFSNLPSGKSATASKSSFTPDEYGTITATWSNVKNLGTVSMTITTDGDISGTAGAYMFSDEYETEDDDDGETFIHGEHTFSADAVDYVLPDGYDLVDETVPMEVSIITSNGKSWNCGSTPSIKYKKVKEDGETWYELTGLDDENKTNYSGLKLKYNSKKGTFSGSFKVYATNAASIEKGKPKLKSYSFSVSGKLSGGSFVGVATCKKLKASWAITIE